MPIYFSWSSQLWSAPFLPDSGLIWEEYRAPSLSLSSFLWPACPSPGKKYWWECFSEPAEGGEHVLCWSSHKKSCHNGTHIFLNATRKNSDLLQEQHLYKSNIKRKLPERISCCSVVSSPKNKQSGPMSYVKQNFLKKAEYDIFENKRKPMWLSKNAREAINDKS